MTAYVTVTWQLICYHRIFLPFGFLKREYSKSGSNHYMLSSNIILMEFYICGHNKLYSKCIIGVTYGFSSGHVWMVRVGP